MSSTPSRAGIELPPTRRPSSSSRRVRSAIAPVRRGESSAAVRSMVLSWITANWSSALRWTSHSRMSAPSATARWNEARVFSGSISAAPRCPTIFAFMSQDLLEVVATVIQIRLHGLRELVQHRLDLGVVAIDGAEAGLDLVDVLAQPVGEVGGLRVLELGEGDPVVRVLVHEIRDDVCLQGLLDDRDVPGVAMPLGGLPQLRL